MNKEIAAEISDLMLECSKKLDASIDRVMSTCSEDESKRYRHAVGELMGIMLLDVMNPIYRAHPELKPSQLS